MTSTIGQFAIAAAILGCGLMAGVFFAFSAFVMRSLGQLSDAEGIRAMQSINRVILRSAFMPVFFGTAAICVGLAVVAVLHLGRPYAAWMLAGGFAYLFGCIGVTMVGNVPLNNRLDAADAGASAAGDVWRHFLARWLMWNHVRTVACILAMLAFLMAFR